jgi:hypothetical protein
MVQTNYFTNDDPQNSPTYRRLGLVNGLLIGLALSAGIWGGPLLFLADLPMPLRYGSLLLQILITILIGGLVGWLTARLAKTGITIVAWFLCGIFIAGSLTHLPERLRTLVVWLADSRFWGLPIYNPPQMNAAAPYLLGFFLILILFVFGILQDYRLEGIQRAAGAGGRWGLGCVVAAAAAAAGVGGDWSGDGPDDGYESRLVVGHFDPSGGAKNGQLRGGFI